MVNKILGVLITSRGISMNPKNKPIKTMSMIQPIKTGAKIGLKNRGFRLKIFLKFKLEYTLFGANANVIEKY